MEWTGTGSVDTAMISRCFCYFPLRFRDISQFPLISPSDLSLHTFNPFPPYFLVSSLKERIVPVPISSHMVWIFSLFFFSMQFFSLFFLEKLPISICDSKLF